MNSANPYDKNKPGIASIGLFMPEEMLSELSLKGIKTNELDTTKREVQDPIGINVLIQTTL
jgi:hypothetical protein